MLLIRPHSFPLTTTKTRQLRSRKLHRTQSISISIEATSDKKSDDEEDKESNELKFNPARAPLQELKEGKYGMGDRIDKALDATTNELLFRVGGILCVSLPVILFLFGPRPSSEY
jgi:hypothetical protein